MPLPTASVRGGQINMKQRMPKRKTMKSSRAVTSISKVTLRSTEYTNESNGKEKY